MWLPANVAKENAKVSEEGVTQTTAPLPVCQYI